MNATLDPEEVAAWVAFYDTSYFPHENRKKQLQELEDGTRWLHMTKEWERPYRIAALRSLVDKDEPHEQAA